MSFFSRLLRKAPPSSPSDPAPAPRPVQPAKAASDPEITSHTFGPELLRIAFDTGHPSSRAAQKRIVELIDAGSVTIDQLPLDAAQLRGTLALAASTADPTNFDRAAANITDETFWVDVAANGSTAKLRQLAAARVESAEQLRAVMKGARERDKTVYRVAKTKLDEIHSAAKRAEEAKAHRLSLAETIEHHSYKPFDGAYVATIEHLEREWRASSVEVPPEVSARVQSAIDRAREAISEHIRAAGARAAHEAAVANAEPVRGSVIEELRKLLGMLYAAPTLDAAALESVADRLGRLHERWRDTLQYQAASPEQISEFDVLRRAVEAVSRSMAEGGTLMQQLQAMRDEPSDATAERLRRLIASRALLADGGASTLDEAEALTRQWHEEQTAKRAASEDAEKQIAQLIRRAQHALSQGRSRQAFGIRRSIDPKLERLELKPKYLSERIQQLDEKLHEIQDWRSFAVTPKRSELIAQMQALIGAEEEPQQLADEIKRLQEEWKSLAKGSHDSDEDWTKFHEAAQAAYAPCKAYFEGQAQERERHLEHKKALLAKLEEYERTTDWENVEWKNVVNAVRSARQEWRSAGHSDRAATRPLEKQFDALLQKVQARIDAEYAANLERKQSLVKQAQRVAAIDDMAQASTEVKRLQAAWRAVGLTPHGEGQKLWEEFKEHCDAVFDKRRKEHTDRIAQLEQNEEQALALCVELETVARRTGAELFAGAARVRELREAFAQLGELPRDRSQEIQRRFKRALEEYEHGIVQERHREADRAWDTLFDAANRIRLAQLEDDAEALEAVNEFVASTQHWPKGGKQVIEGRLTAKVDANREANADALRTLAIRAEIATGAATPDADQTQRRTMQLQALVKGIGRTSASPAEQLEALAFEWVRVGPTETDIHDELFARFKRAWTLARK